MVYRSDVSVVGGTSRAGGVGIVGSPHGPDKGAQAYSRLIPIAGLTGTHGRIARDPSRVDPAVTLQDYTLADKPLRSLRSKSRITLCREGLTLRSLKHFLRRLQRAPMFTAIAAIFSVVEGVW